MKVYVAGPMTGLPNFNRDNFFRVADEIKLEGHVVLNPAILPDGLTQKEYMSICIPMAAMCDAIYLLEGWKNSPGARAEVAMAEKLGLEIIMGNVKESVAC